MTCSIYNAQFEIFCEIAINMIAICSLLTNASINIHGAFL